MTVPLKVTSKEIDFKSLLIGILLATVVFLGIGAYSGSGTQDVRIVGIYTRDTLPVKIEKIDAYTTLPVKIEKIDSDITIPVSIADVKYSMEIPVKIMDQPIEVKQR